MNSTRWLRIKDHAGRVLMACLVVSLVASVFWYRQLATDSQPQAPGGIPANDSQAEMVSLDFKHVETRMDRTIWVLESARAEIFEDRANLQEVKVTWYGEPGEITVVITSAEGTVDFRERNAELRGNVRVERADGAILTTEKITWDEKTKMLRAPLPVVITTPSFTFRGRGLDANLATEHITLLGRVEGEVHSRSLAGSPRS